MLKLNETTAETKYLLDYLRAEDKIDGVAEFIACLDRYGYGDGTLEALNFTPQEMTATISYNRPGSRLELKLQEELFCFFYTLSIAHEHTRTYQIQTNSLAGRHCQDFIKLMHTKKFTEDE